MEIGTDQLNSFDTFSLDCWKDHVYYEGQKFPAGHFAAEILNFAGEACDPLLERISTLITLVEQAASAGKDEGVDVLAELQPLMKETVSWIYACPPFCYQDDQQEWEEFALATDADQFEQDCDTDPEHLPYKFFSFSEQVLKILVAIYNFCLLIRVFEQKYLRGLERRTDGAFAKAAHDCFDQDCDTDPEHLPYQFLSFSEQVLKILVAIYNFCLLIRVFEQKYLRGLERRTDGAFAQAAHECFDEDDSFLILLEQMPFGEIEEFFHYPRLVLGFNYIQDPNDEKKWATVQHVVCKRLIDFYVFDLLNGLHHGHGPSWCHNCHRYFLTTTAHTPKYCDGIAPQDSRMTCRQYGAMMHQKEQNKQHPVYNLFSTRTNTIRKHHQRGKISDELRREALYVAECYRDKALMDNDYAANGYAQDMEQEHVYAEARKRLT